MGIPDHLTCLLRNLYAGQEAAVKIGHGKTDWFQIGKGVHQGCIFVVIDIFLEILIPACASSSPGFRMMHSAYNLNKKGDNI